MKLALPLVLAALACPAWAAPDFNAWAEGVAAQRVRANPVQATIFQYFAGDEQAALDGQFMSIARPAVLANVARERKALAQLHGFDTQALTPVQKVSARVIAWSLAQDIAAADYLDDEFLFNQMSGLQVEPVNFMTQQQPLRNARDVQSYLQRLARLAPLMDEGIARTRAADAHGVLMPRFITTKVIAQFETFLAPAAAGNVLVTALSQRMARIDGLGTAQRETARARAESIVAGAVLPAWKRGLALMRSQLPRTTDDAGVWRLKGGDKLYAARLRRATTTAYTPAEIHAIGLAQVARIEGEMDGLLKQLGYADGSVKDRFAKMDADHQPQGADPRAELLERYTAILRDAQARARLVFDVRPEAPVEVRREPALTEATAAAHYTSPAPDGSRPGIFWAPLPGPTFEISEMRTLVYHEAVPGHHFQIAVQQEASGLPPYRRNRVFASGSAFVEGWALYAEQLAAENGWYQDDPVGRLGQLHAALFRARRLVVDTGLHAMKWTRQQAIDYGISATEVDRYVVWPGQACAYMLGRLRIEALRDKARAALGEKFDIKQFHNLVLLAGDVPLEVLEGVVDDWIQAQA